MAVADELAGLGAGGGPAGAVDHVVEAELEEPEHVLAGDAGATAGLVVEVAELLLGEAVGEAGLLLLLQLEQVLARCCRGGGCGRARREGRGASRGRSVSPLVPKMLVPRRRETRALGSGVTSHAQTLRRLGGRQPLWGTGVTSLMPVTSMPVFWMRADGGLTARAGALDLDVDLADAVLHGPAGGCLGRHLGGVRGATCASP